MYTLANVDLLFYYFIESSDLYILRFDKLRQWAFGGDASPANIYIHPEKRQAKHAQRNDTWGRCVPIHIIEKSVRVVHKNLTDTTNLSCVSPMSAPPSEIEFVTNLLPPEEVSV
jgi:hypothetical protein